MNDLARPNPFSHEQLVRSALPLLHTIAHRMWRRLHYRLDLDELVSVGLATLHDAAGRYDPARGSFPGYLIKRLTWAMHTEARRGPQADDSYPGDPLGVATRFLDSHPRLVRVSPGNEEDAAVPSIFEYGIKRTKPVTASGNLGEVAMERANDPEETSMRREAEGVLRSSLASLPPRERAIVERHYFDGEQFSEVAGELGISKTRACRLHRAALQLLARQLKKAGIERGSL